MLGYSRSTHSYYSTQFYKLSQVFKESRSSHLDLSNQQINIIDNLQSQAIKNIFDLKLNNNNIKRLCKIIQFSSIKVLDLSNNQIQDCNELLYLKEIESLKVIKLIGNPFLQVSISDKVLEYLMDKEIDIEFRQQQQEKIMQKKLLNNHLEIIFLTYASKLIDVQIQFSKTQRHIEQSEISIRYLLDNKNILKEYQASILEKYLQSIKIEASYIKKQQSISLLDAYDQVSSIQNQEKVDLINILTSKVSEYNKIKRNKGNQKYFSSPRKSLISIYNMQLTQQTIKIRRNQSSNKSPFSKTQKKPLRNFNCQNKYQQRYYKNLPKLNPVYNLLYSPIVSLKSAQKDLLIENLSDDLKKMAITVYMKQQQIFQKQHLLTKRIKQLQTFLEQSKQQNEQILLTLNKKQKQITVLRKNNQVIDELDEKIINKNKQIDKLKNQVDELKQKCQYLQYDVDKYQEYNQIEDVVKNRRKAEQKRQIWDIIIDRFKKIKIFKQAQNRRQAQLIQQMKYLVIQNMKICVDQKKKVSLIKNKKDKINKKYFINNFKQYGIQSRKYGKLQILLENKRIRKQFPICASIICHSILMKKLMIRANTHNRKTLMNKSFKALKIQWIKYNNPSFIAASNQVLLHYQCKLKVKALQGFMINKDIEQQIRKQQISQLNKVFKQQELINRQISNKIKRHQLKKSIVKIFEKTWKQSIKQKCHFKLKSFYLEDVNNTTRKRFFLKSLGNHSKKYLGYKTEKLTESIIEMKLKSALKDFSGVLCCNMRNQRLIRRNLIRNLLKRQYFAFHHLKSLAVQRRINYQTQQIQPIPEVVQIIQEIPQINVQEYEIRQAHLIKLNDLLKLQIETKQEQTSLCHQKISNLQFEVTNQQIKYEQLLAVHEGSLLEMRNREAQLLQVVMMLQQKKQYTPIAEMKQDLKKARIFNNSIQRNFVYKRDF